jgi:hypothetical protein
VHISCVTCVGDHWWLGTLENLEVDPCLMPIRKGESTGSRVLVVVAYNKGDRHVQMSAHLLTWCEDCNCVRVELPAKKI